MNEEEDMPMSTSRSRTSYLDGTDFRGVEPELRRRHDDGNGNKRRKRRKRYDDEDDGEREDYLNCRGHKEELLPKWKMMLVGGAIFICFALLYPSVFGPVVNSIFGAKRDQPVDRRSVHPSMSGPHPNQREPHPGRPAHPHPATAQMPQVQQGQAGGGGRGGFAWLLPFYTIGVVCFLLYTLMKMMFKSKKKEKRKSRLISSWGGENSSVDEDEPDDIYGARGQKLSSIQARLRKTEHAMQEILQQLELVANQSHQLKQPQQQAGQEEAGLAEETTEESREKLTAKGLNEEQTARVEDRLKELKMLSELCKRDQLLQRRLRENSSTKGTDEEEEEEKELLEDEQEDELEDDGNGGMGSQTEDESSVSEDEENEVEKREEKPRKRTSTTRKGV